MRLLILSWIFILVLSVSSRKLSPGKPETTHFFTSNHFPASFSPNSDEDEIDERYGVSKRQVPTGPNPLHN
ncbi:hypothetical protein AMTRI_Chr07g81690 [Amborella trichopoda]